MSPDIQSLFDKDKSCAAAPLCATRPAWSVVSRPRLWWVSALAPPAPNEPLPSAVCGGLARWKRYNRFWQLLPSSSFFPCQVACTCNTATFHTEVAQGRALCTQFGSPPQKRRRRHHVAVKGGRPTVPTLAVPYSGSSSDSGSRQDPGRRHARVVAGLTQRLHSFRFGTRMLHTARQCVALLRCSLPSVLGAGAVTGLVGISQLSL